MERPDEEDISHPGLLPLSRAAPPDCPSLACRCRHVSSAALHRIGGEHGASNRSWRWVRRRLDHVGHDQEPLPTAKLAHNDHTKSPIKATVVPWISSMPAVHTRATAN